jgi:hypothetical protein
LEKIAMFHRFGYLALVFATVPSIAIAAQVKVGSASINLPSPTGFCEMSASTAPDSQMVGALSELVSKSGNKMLAVSADCRQLADWRAKKRQFIDDYANYQTTFSGIDSPAAPEPVKQTCSVLREQGTKILSNQVPDLKTRIEQTLQQIKLNEANFLGVLDEDAGACYGGLVQKLRVNDKTNRTQVTLFAATTVKNKSIFVYRIAIYANSATVPNVLGRLKATVGAFYAANK